MARTIADADRASFADIEKLIRLLGRGARKRVD